MRTLFRLLTLIGLIAVVATPAAAQYRSLFSEDQGRLRVDSAANPAVIRSRAATVDTSLLAAAGGSVSGLSAPSAARTIDLDLFGDVRLVAQLQRVEAVPGTGGFAWVGEVAGVEGSQVVLSVAGGVLSGTVNLPNASYSVRPSPAGGYVISEVQASTLPRDEAAARPAASRDRLVASSAAAAAADSGDVVDLLLYYTTATKTAAGGTAAINSLVTASIAQVNSVFAASGLSLRVRLVAALETDYAESGTARVDAEAIRNRADVRAARDQFGADLVTVLVSRDPQSSGWAYYGVSNGNAFPEYGYSAVVYYNYFGYIYSLAHEIGHNLGCLHEPGNNGGADNAGAFPYSLGYTDTAHRFYDVMSYGCSGCSSINQFSSQVNMFQGLPTGTAQQDNARTINETRFLVANFRPTAAAAIEAPSALAANVSGTNVTLTWRAVGGATGYVLEVGSAAGLSNLGTLATGSAATSFFASGVPAGTYYVRVRAQSAAGTSLPSNEVAVVVR